MQFITFATLGVLLSMSASLGEELGWRGFLLTELRQIFPEKQIHVIIGIIWFFYHAPLIVFSNYNNGNISASLICFFVMVMGFTVLADHLCNPGAFFLARRAAACQPQCICPVDF